jgi:TBC1 domain family member 5
MTFVEDAMYLRSHLNSEGGSHLIAKYTGKAPEFEERRSRSLHTPQSSVDHAQRSPLRSPTRYIQESGGIETMIQEAAKGVYKRGEKLGLNQALRGAVQQLQAVNNSPRRYIAAARRSMDGSPAVISDNHGLHQRIESLEGRNRALAKLIQTAMDELTEQSRALEEEKHESAANKLTLTVAKLQFVHVYLDNPTLPLNEEPSSPSQGPPPAASQSPKPPPVEDEETISWSPTQPKEQRGRSPTSQGKGIPSFRVPPPTTSNIIRESPTRRYIPRRRPPSAHGSTPLAASPTSNTPAPIAQASASPSSPPTVARDSTLHKPRPSLAQSSFSWMLGSGDGEADKRGFAAASTFPPEQERKGVTDKKTRGRTGFLFGDDGDSGSSAAKTSGKEDGKEDDDGFTLGTLRGVGEGTS